MPSAASRTRRPAIIVRRGGGREVLENTWSAVEHVVVLGLKWMETNLRLAADDVVVLGHDEDLRRTANDPRTVGEVMWAELADLNSDDGRGFIRLDDALYAQPAMRFNIDLKDSCVVQAALQTVHDAQVLDRVRFASFSARRLAVLRRQELRAMTSLGVGDTLGLMLRSEAAVPLSQTHWGWTRGRVDAVQVPESYHNVSVVTRRFVASAHTADLEVRVWTVDDPEQVRHLADLNVDAIMIDAPSPALKTLG